MAYNLDKIVYNLGAEAMYHRVPDDVVSNLKDLLNIVDGDNSIVGSYKTDSFEVGFVYDKKTDTVEYSVSVL